MNFNTRRKARQSFRSTPLQDKMKDVNTFAAPGTPPKCRSAGAVGTANCYAKFNFKRKFTFCERGPFNYPFLRRIRQRGWLVSGTGMEEVRHCHQLYTTRAFLIRSWYRRFTERNFSATNIRIQMDKLHC